MASAQFWDKYGTKLVCPAVAVAALPDIARPVRYAIIVHGRLRYGEDGMQVVVLAADGASTWMLVNALKAEYPSLQVALEKSISRWPMMKRRIARVGIWTVLGQALFMLYLPMLRRLNRARTQELINNARLNTRQPSDMAIQQFDSANSDECLTWLAEENPDVVVLNGTRIVSPAVLGSCGAVFLNTHCGITPAYRGVHGGYWALYQREPENAGVTVHVVDAGIDTGDIIYQALIEVDAHDNFLTYPVKQYVAGIPLMRQALADLAAGCLRTKRRSDLKSAIWQHPTFWQYVGARWLRGVR